MAPVVHYPKLPKMTRSGCHQTDSERAKRRNEAAVSALLLAPREKTLARLLALAPMSRVNYFFSLTTIISPDRVASPDNVTEW
jgi:hypothetical protein